MGEVENLRRFRKRKERAARDQEAAANRAKFGRTRAEKAAEKDERERAERTLDGAKRDPE
jgi:hypothetical protein